MADIVDPGLLQVGDKGSIIYVTLGIKIPVSDDYLVKEIKISPIPIILELAFLHYGSPG